ncbi:MAG: hypothetical protein K2M05_03110, partial [Paramuribaculum sp.]|nr:hypothetical protein [Paramuribaculum sp.]
MNTRKIIEIKAAVSVESPGAVSECVNLRPSPTRGEPALMPVAFPETLVAQGGWRPVCELPEDNGVTLLLTDAANRIAMLSPSGNTPAVVADTGGNGSGSVMCGVSTGDGKAIVMTTLGPLTLSRRANVWQKDNDDLLLGVPTFETELLQPVSETVTGLKLTSTDDLRAGISAKDIAAVTKAVTAAYMRLEQLVAVSGAVMTPVAAAWRLCDGEGRVKRSSLPVVLGKYLTPGISATGAIGTDGAIGPLTFTVTPSRVAAVVPPLADGSVPAIIELLASTGEVQTPPVVTCRIDNPSGSNPSLKVTVFPATSPRYEDLFSLRKVATVRGMAGSSVTASLRSAPAGDLPVTIPSIAPGGFVAGCVARHGDVTLWGDITLRNCEVFPLESIAVSFNDSAAWIGAVRVTLADGSKGVFMSGDTKRAPRELSPLICFPRHDAVTLEAWINTGSEGIKSVGPIALTPAPEGDYAYAITSDFSPRKFVESHSPMPVESVELPVRASGKGMILCAPASNPLAPVSHADCGAAKIIALATSPRSRSSWQFGCGHLYAFTSEGVWGVGVSSSAGRALSVGALSMGAVMSPGHITQAGDCVAALTAGGREVTAMSGASAKSLTTPLPGMKFNGLGFIPATGSLLLRHGEGNLLALDPSRRDCHSIALPFAPDILFTGSEALYLGDSDSLAALSASSVPAETTSVKWRASIAIPPGRPRLNRLAVMMSCSDCDLTITLSAKGYP